MHRRYFLAAATAASQTQAESAKSCAAPQGAGGITEQDFRAYIDAFNRSDFPGFARYYAENVVFEGTGGRHFEGPEQILAFYRTVKARLKETITIRTLVIGAQDIAAELETELVAFEDWPDLPTGPISKGETIRSLNFVWYEVRDGKFTQIRSARYRRL